MSIDNNIDQMFSDAAHSQKAPQYDPVYWAEMNAMLNAKDAKKRALILWTLGGTSLFAVLFLSLFVFNMNFNTPQVRYAQTKLTNNMSIDTIENKFKNNDWIQDHSSSIHEELNTITKENQDKDELSSNQLQTLGKETINKTPFLNERNVSNSTMTSEKEYTFNQEETDLKATIINSSDAKANNSENLIALNEHTVSSLPFNYTNSIVQNKTKNIFESNFKYKPRPRLTLYAKTSAGLMENYKTSRPYESGLIDLSLNLEGNFNGVLLRSGLGIQHTSNADLILSRRAKVYGFGVTNHQNDLSYQGLFDVYIPLEFGYKTNRTSFGIGIQANYLLTTSMDLNFYENHNLINTERYYGSTNGLNEFTSQGYLWMEQQLTSRISLGAKVGTNISGRIKDDAYFNQSSTTNPIYGQFTLRFNILQ